MNDNSFLITEGDVEFHAIRAQGPGGQHVNKTSSAIHLRFDIKRSSLSEEQQSKILRFHDSRISTEGIIVIKAQNFRVQEKNKEQGLERLNSLIEKALHKPKTRKASRPSLASKNRRMDKKTKIGRKKSLRKRPDC